MKQFYLLIALAIGLASCHITNSEEPEVKKPVNTFEAIGTQLIPSSGFTKKDVLAKVVLGENNKLNIYMYDIKFAAAMPVTIDMIISDVDYTRQGDEVNFTGENIVPTAGDKPYDKYIVTNLVGKITADSLIITNNYGQTPSVYRGKLKK